MESKTVRLFNKLSFWSLMFSIFASLFFFIPYVPVTLEASKGFLLSVGATLSLFFWLIARLGEGKFVIPKDRLILFAGIIPLVFLIASFFSSSLYVSLFGNGFEIGTFGSMLIMFIIFFLCSQHFQTEKRLWKFIGGIFLGGFILAIFELINVFIGFNRFLPNMLQGISFGNLVGSWSNFALLFGLMVLLSLFTLEFLKTKKIHTIFQYFLLVVSVLFLAIINIPLVWLLVGIFSVIIFVYSVSIQHAGSKIVMEGGKKGKFPFAALVIILISLAFLIGNNLIGNSIAKVISIPNNDIRPSIVTTSQITWRSIKHNPAFGTGPNTFIVDWSLWQPKAIAQTLYWNTNFDSGFSLLTTFAVTTGILGLISILLFLVVFFIRGIQSLRVALQNPISNYFILTTFIIALYSWITVILYNPNIIMLMLAFASSGVLIGILVHKEVMPVRTFSFLNDPRNSFFAILGLMVLMVSSLALTYVYIEKFTSIIYFSRSMNAGNTMELLDKSEVMLNDAISLDKNDVYYRNLSQVYIAKINLLANDKTVSADAMKSNLQQLINLAQGNASAAVSQNPKQYLNYVNLGDVYTALVPLQVENSYDSAVGAYTKAGELAPNNPSILLSRASLEVINKNNDQARVLIKQALDLKANYTDAIFLLAQIETNEGNLLGAIKQAEYAGEMSPNDPTIFFRLGLLRYNNSDYTGAVSAFGQAVMLNNNYLNARYFLALSYQKVGRSNDALTQFKILSKVLPENQELKDAINGNGMDTPVVSAPTTTTTTKNTPTTTKDTSTKTKTTTDIKPLPEKQ